MTFKVQIKGGPETALALRELGRATAAEKVMRQALRPGAAEVVKEARARVPVATGALRRSIAIGIKKPGRYISRLLVGHRYPRARISHLVEFGTRKSRAQPYMRPAYTAAAARVVQLFGADIWPRIVREATRVAARAGVRRR